MVSPAEVNYESISKKNRKIFLSAVPQLSHYRQYATISFVERHLQNVFLHVFNKLFKTFNFEILFPRIALFVLGGNSQELHDCTYKANLPEEISLQIVSK